MTGSAKLPATVGCKLVLHVGRKHRNVETSLGCRWATLDNNLQPKVGADHLRSTLQRTSKTQRVAVLGI